MKNLLKTNWTRAAFAVFALIGLSATSKATLLTLTQGEINQSLSSDGTNTISGTEIASNAVSVGGGTLYEAVYEVGSTLNFYYALTLTTGSTGVITLNFPGVDSDVFTTMVGYVSGDTLNGSGISADASAVAPSDGGRGTAGDDGISFSLGSTLTGGESTAILEVSTNATLAQYNSLGNVYLSSANASGTYEPIPEPTTILFGLGLLGAMVVVRRRPNHAEPQAHRLAAA